MEDTIVALSSAPCGPASAWLPCRSILRLSGPEALPLAGQVFRSAPPLQAAPSWRRVRGRARWRQHELPASAYVMPAPRSYTRQDLIELHLPAYRQSVSELYAHLVQAGARAARPGEFTRRALLNGRITIAQAEAVGALIRAESADAARALAARATSAGNQFAGALRSALEELLAEVELGLDFSQEDVACLSRAEISARLAHCAARVAGAATGPQADSEWGALPCGAPSAVLVGLTNAGKSRLFNVLAGKNLALVSATRHTTRDALEASIRMDPDIHVRLFDTAGQGEVHSQYRPLAAASEAALHLARTADILILALDRSRPINRSTLTPLLSSLAATRPELVVLLWTKADLPPDSAWQTAAPLARLEISSQIEAPRPLEELAVSSYSGEGIPALRELLGRAAQELALRTESARAVAEAVTCAGSRRAAQALERATAGWNAGLGEDALAAELREALQALAESAGLGVCQDGLTERVLDKIFAKFCIGK